MNAVLACRRCSVPLLPGTSSCPFCGVSEPAPTPVPRAVAACWVGASVMSFAVTHELLHALVRAVA